MFTLKKMAFVQNPFSFEFTLKQRQSAPLKRRIGNQTQPSGTPMKVPTVDSLLASKVGLVRYLRPEVREKVNCQLLVRSAFKNRL